MAPTPAFLPRESMDRGAWLSKVYTITKSGTQLKQFSTRALMSFERLEETFKQGQYEEHIASLSLCYP